MKGIGMKGIRAGCRGGVRRVVFPAGLAIAPMLLLTACSDSAAPPASEIRVSGSAIVSAEPDVAVLSLGVDVTRSTVNEARTAAASTLAAIVAAVRDAGVEEEEVRTFSFSIHPQYRYGSPETRFLGHQVQHQLSVTVRDVEAAGSVIDSAVAAGGAFTRVQGVDFRVADTAALEREARRLALQDAIKTADFYAAELGLDRGAIAQVSDQVDVRYSSWESGQVQSRAAATSTEFHAGQFEVSAGVEVVFAME